MSINRDRIAESLQQNTHYIVSVSHNESDPIHKAIFFHSADGKGTVYTLGYNSPARVNYRTIHYMLIGEPFYL